jgi:hypothetical protein
VLLSGQLVDPCNIYLEQIRALKAGSKNAMKDLAWDNGIGPMSIFIGLIDMGND